MSVLSHNVIAGASIADDASGDGYQIERSLRFNNSDNPILKRTPSSSGNRRIWTFSTWVKRGDLVSGNDIGSGVMCQMIFCAGDSSENGSIEFWGDSLTAFHHSSSSFQWQVTTNAKFRDLSAWYHIVVACDTNQAVAADRLKLYVNGEQQTSFSTATYPAQFYSDNPYNEDNEIQSLGNYAGANNFKYDGYYADVYMIDGLQLSPAAFGSFD